MPIGLPPLCVTFSQKLSAEEVEAIKNRGAGIIPNKDDTQIRYTFAAENVTKDLLDFLYRHSKKVNSRCATPMGSVNIAVVQSLCKTNAIFTWFLKTQSYPAFIGPVEDIEAEAAYSTIEGFITLKRKVQEPKESSSKKPRVETEADEEEDEMDLDEQAQALDEYHFGDEISRVPKAKPSTPPTVIYGPISTLPTLPGMTFPYFDEMMEPDGAFTAGVIRDFFLESLGDERIQILSAYKDLKLHLGLLAVTRVGKILQHIAVGIRLAIQAQARVYPVFEGGRYAGFTLHGYYFSVAIDGMRHTPKLHNELVQEASSIDEHNVALANILLKLSKLKMTDTKRVPTKQALKDAKAGLTTSRRLANFLRQFEMDDDARDGIEALAVNLSFPQRFWPLDGVHIIKAVDLLLAGSFPPEDIPLYPGGGTLTTKDHRLSIFASFGDTAFSFRLPGGNPLKVPKSVDLDTMFKTYKGKGGKETTPKPNIVIAKKSHSLCLEDWAAFLSDHTVYAKQNRDAIFRSTVLGGDKAKNFWYDLIKRIGPLTIDDTKKIAVDEVDNGGDALDDTVDDFADFL
jgi:hypothetical protein